VGSPARQPAIPRGSAGRWLLARLVDHDHDQPAEGLVVVEQGLQVTRQVTALPRRLVARVTVDRVPFSPFMVARIAGRTWSTAVRCPG
jgi:hypothetical protein